MGNEGNVWGGRDPQAGVQDRMWGRIPRLGGCVEGFGAGWGQDPQVEGWGWDVGGGCGAAPLTKVLDLLLVALHEGFVLLLLLLLRLLLLLCLHVEDALGGGWEGHNVTPMGHPWGEGGLSPMGGTPTPMRKTQHDPEGAGHPVGGDPT